jgi:hypothetical protein
MLTAAKSTPPVRKTVNEWTAYFGISKATLYRAKYAAPAIEAAMLMGYDDVPTESVVPLYRSQNRNHKGNVYDRLALRIGGRVLQAAGLDNADKVQLQIDRKHNRITISLIEKTNP